jgi:predicted transcriptional regulator
MTAITVNLSDDVLQKLQTQAKDRHMALEAYIEATLLDVVIKDDEPTKEDVLKAIREGIISVEQGDFGRPIHELLDELEQEEIEEHADSR